MENIFYKIRDFSNMCVFKDNTTWIIVVASVFSSKHWKNVTI